MITFQLPTDTRIQAVDRDGNVLFQSELYHLHSLLAQAQQGEDYRDASSWVPKFSLLLEMNFHVKIEDSAAFFLAEGVMTEVLNLKKKLNVTPTLPQPTESTPLN